MTVRRRPAPSLTRRVIGLAVLAVAAISGLSALLGARLLDARLDTMRDTALSHLSDQVIFELRAKDLAELGEDPDLGPPRFNEIYSGAYWQVDPGVGEDQVIRSRSLWDTALALPEAPSTGFLDAVGPNAQRLRVLRTPITLDDTPLDVAVALDTAEYSDIGTALTRLTLGALIAQGLLAVLAVAATSYVGLRAMRAFTAELGELRAGRRETLGTDVPREIAPAAEEVNQLKGAQARLIARARDQAASLAHSLKTPLAVLIQAAQNDSAVPARLVRDQADAALQHVNHHLALARSAGGAGRSATPLKPVLDGILRVLKPRLAERGVTVELELPPSLAAPMDEADLYDLIGNVVDNAARHAASRIAIRAWQAGGETRIRVADDGPGLSKAAMAEVLVRGARPASGRDRSGLGLSLAHELARSYDGDMTLEPASEGGLCVTFTLPGAVDARA